MRLRADGLSCRRGGRRVFSGAELTAEPGEIVELRGANGSGKSTLLRALAGLLPIDAGEARIGDASLTGERDAYQERLIYAGHLDAVKPALTLRENLAFWIEFFGESRLEIDALCAQALERVQLEALADAPAAHCSAGQRRRLGLARLAALKRPLWLLDEPLAALDAASISALGALLEEHRAGGGVAVIATHAPLPAPAAHRVDMSSFAPETAPFGGEDLDDPFAAPLDDPATTPLVVERDARR